jgi:hypothetical protein
LIEATSATNRPTVTHAKVSILIRGALPGGIRQD